MMCGKGFGMILVLFWATALSSDLSLVSGQTVAPLTSSTSAPPKMEVKPTKPMIVNAPPKKQMPMAPEAPKLNGSKPMQVTGFITKSGNIYEIEDKRGAIGSIEGRQADEGQIVCNYGSVVIYSDVPCDKVRNVRVGEVKPLKQDPLEDHTEKNPVEGEQQSQELQPAEQQQAVAEDQSQDLEQQQDQEQPNHPRGQSQNNRRRRRRRPQQQQQQQRLQQQRRRRQQQQKLQQRRRNGNGNGNNSLRRRRNGNRNNINNNNRNRQQQRRRRPNNNNNRRRLNNNNNGQRQQQRRQQQRRRPNSNINRQQQQRRRLRDGNN
ncbi:probable serine/threonine-protein kinase dyrk1 [Drosophila subpulchrella]|uniref:probable serine/threonine-protein kinase dyrk1 n=1 Tax=Drosophila subpulchrella TaxID=1486046 RepID=UPI0018A1A7EA|nr:probable serine/threonine-protein kinase dyrk1 [Drosophila subpulchrella]